MSLALSRYNHENLSNVFERAVYSDCNYMLLLCRLTSSVQTFTHYGNMMLVSK